MLVKNILLSALLFLLAACLLCVAASNDSISPLKDTLLQTKGEVEAVIREEEELNHLVDEATQLIAEGKNNWEFLHKHISPTMLKQFKSISATVSFVLMIYAIIIVALTPIRSQFEDFIGKTLGLPALENFVMCSGNAIRMLIGSDSDALPACPNLELIKKTMLAIKFITFLLHMIPNHDASIAQLVGKMEAVKKSAKPPTAFRPLQESCEPSVPHFETDTLVSGKHSNIEPEGSVTRNDGDQDNVVPKETERDGNEEQTPVRHPNEPTIAIAAHQLPATIDGSVEDASHGMDFESGESLHTDASSQNSHLSLGGMLLGNHVEPAAAKNFIDDAPACTEPPRYIVRMAHKTLKMAKSPDTRDLEHPTIIVDDGSKSLDQKEMQRGGVESQQHALPRDIGSDATDMKGAIKTAEPKETVNTVADAEKHDSASDDGSGTGTKSLAEPWDMNAPKVNSHPSTNNSLKRRIATSKINQL